MKSRNVSNPGPRLVTSRTAEGPGQSERDHLIAEGVLAYQQLQEQFDAELFSPDRDLEVIASLLQQKNLLRERLAAYGVKVRA